MDFQDFIFLILQIGYAISVLVLRKTETDYDMGF